MLLSKQVPLCSWIKGPDGNRRSRVTDCRVMRYGGWWRLFHVRRVCWPTRALPTKIPVNMLRSLNATAARSVTSLTFDKLSLRIHCHSLLTIMVTFSYYTNCWGKPGGHLFLVASFQVPFSCNQDDRLMIVQNCIPHSVETGGETLPVTIRMWLGRWDRGLNNESDHPAPLFFFF